MLNPILTHLTYKELLVDSAFVLVLLLASIRSDFGQSAFRRIEIMSSRLARRKVSAILFIGVVPIIIRLCLLPIIPVPIPQIHDEFSYLLAADTFAHGRLTNPPHPMSLFIDTIHVNQRPNYMSKYPPAQGMILAAEQFLTAGAFALGVGGDLIDAASIAASKLELITENAKKYMDIVRTFRKVH